MTSSFPSPSSSDARGQTGLAVVTNNGEVALILGDVEGIELHLTGGVWRTNDRDLVGSDTIGYFEKFHATHAVVGAGGLHPTSGALDFRDRKSTSLNHRH